MTKTFRRGSQKHFGSDSLTWKFISIGDAAGPSRGISEPALLHWIEENDRVLVSLNRRSLPGHLADHLEAGLHVPGILLIAARATWAEVIENVLAVSSTIDADALRDQIRYLPI